MSATVIGPVEDALLALLVADGTLAAIEGPPQLGQPSDPPPRAVWIDPETDSTQAADLSGGTERVETFELRVVCFAASSGSAYTSPRDAAAALADRVSAIIMANFHLSFQVGIVDIHQTGLKRDYGAWDKTQGYMYSVRITCQAVLT